VTGTTARLWEYQLPQMTLLPPTCGPCDPPATWMAALRYWATSSAVSPSVAPEPCSLSPPEACSPPAQVYMQACCMQQEVFADADAGSKQLASYCCVVHGKVQAATTPPHLVNQLSCQCRCA
jgi:hypothetical protein